jgi:hypothetical protein
MLAAEQTGQTRLQHANNRSQFETGGDFERQNFTSDPEKVGEIRDGNNSMPKVQDGVIEAEGEKSCYHGSIDVPLPLGQFQCFRSLGGFGPSAPNLPTGSWPGFFELMSAQGTFPLVLTV